MTTWRERLGYALIALLLVQVLAARAAPPYSRDPVSEGVLTALGDLYTLLNAPLAQTSSAVTKTSATVGVASAQALGAGTRIFLKICNESSSAFVAYNLGGSAALNSAGSKTLVPYQCDEFSGSYVPSDAVNMIASAISTPVTILSK